jgi:hypothetical protein
LVGEGREAEGTLRVVLEAGFPEGGDEVGKGVVALVFSEAGSHAAELVGKSSSRETFGVVDVEEREPAIQHRVAFTANMVARGLVIPTRFAAGKLSTDFLPIRPDLP